MDVEDGRPRLGPDPHPELDGLGQDDFLFGREQRHARDLAEVQARRVLDVEVSVAGIRIGVRVRSGLGPACGRDVVDDRLQLDPLELGRGHDRIRRLGVMQLGVVRELDQGCSVCE